MDEATREFVLNIMEQANDLTLATIRPDGYPQATTLSYGHEDLTLYASIGRHSQKADNIRHCDKVSVTINTEYLDWNHIKGLSMGARAEILTDDVDIQRAGECLARRFPQVRELEGTDAMTEIVFLKITPLVISVLNYEKGFGHADLVTV